MTEEQFRAQHPGKVESGIAVVSYWRDVTVSVRIDRSDPAWESAVWQRLDAAIAAVFE